jgi:hypothetical protein
MYAGALGDNAVERYARFLASLGLDASPPERRHALVQAREHGLDVERVAVVAAERTMGAAFERLPRLKGPLPPVGGDGADAREEEVLLLRSIEWTTFQEGTFGTALEQANAIMRYFLGALRTHSAHDNLLTIPRSQRWAARSSRARSSTRSRGSSPRSGPCPRSTRTSSARTARCSRAPTRSTARRRSGSRTGAG